MAQFRITTSAWVLAFFLTSGVAFGQGVNSYPLAGQTSVANSTGSFPVTFKTATVNLSCPSSPTVKLSSTADGTGKVFVDNLVNLTVGGNTTNVCEGASGATTDPTFTDCFTEPWHSEATNYLSPPANSDTLASTYGVGPIDISSKFSAGGTFNSVKFDEVDYGGIVAGASLYLVTNCTSVGPQTTTLPFTQSTTPQSKTALFNAGDFPNEHSAKFTCTPNSTFTINVTAFEVPPSQANGICAAGQTESTDFDCRFAQYFGTPATPASSLPLPSQSITTPLCIPYSHGNCVYYRVSNPQGGTCGTTNTVTEYIAWNFDQNTMVLPTGYVNNPRMYDDPEAPPYDINHQFVFDITTFFNPNGEAGVDAGTGGRTTSFNDFVIADPYAGSGTDLTSSYVWVSPLKPPNVTSANGSTLPVKFKLTGATPAIATTSPNYVQMSVFQCASSSNCNPNSTSNIWQPVTFAGGYTGFAWDPVKLQYQTNISLSKYASGKTYVIWVSSDLFKPQYAFFKK